MKKSYEYIFFKNNNNNKINIKRFNNLILQVRFQKQITC